MSILIQEGTTTMMGEPLVENMNYEGGAGAYAILAENVVNDSMIFNSILRGDAGEVKSIREGATEAELLSIHESSGSTLIENIKGFLKKAYEKIKGLLESFITRLQTIVTRDNKKLVERHRSAVLSKDLSKFKYSWRENKENKTTVFPKIVEDSSKLFDTLQKGLEQTDYEKDLTNATVRGLAGLGSKEYTPATTEEKVKSMQEIFGVKGAKLEYGALVPSMMDALYDERKEHEGMDKRLMSNIMEVLSTSKDVIKGLQDSKKKVDNKYNTEIRNLDKIKNELAKMVPSGGTAGEHKVSSEDAAAAVRGVNVLYTGSKLSQEYMVKAISTNISIIKIKTKECRAAFSRAAAYRAVGEETEVVEGDKETAVEINIEIEDQEEDKELMEAIDDDAEHVVEEQFTGGFGY